MKSSAKVFNRVLHAIVHDHERLRQKRIANLTTKERTTRQYLEARHAVPLVGGMALTHVCGRFTGQSQG